MKYKVIFDTNSIRSMESIDAFLGGRSDLSRFSNVAEILIPDLVLEEIINQKRKHLLSKKSSFLQNPFHELLKIEKIDSQKFDIEKWIIELSESEKIPYTVIYLTKNLEAIFKRIKKMCLKGLPPFEESTDKGFKDAYIYFTILEYVNENKGGTTFVVTKDERLKTALENDSRIQVVRDFDEFEKYNTSYFYSDYFISRLKEEVGNDVQASCIGDIYLNFDDNWIVKIDIAEQKYLIEVDFQSKEILSFSISEPENDINGLINSGSFSTTHSYIDSLKDKIVYLSNEDIRRLITAAVDNGQIYWVSEDDDVKSFFGTLYKAKSNIFEDEVRLKFTEHFGQI